MIAALAGTPATDRTPDCLIAVTHSASLEAIGGVVQGCCVWLTVCALHILQNVFGRLGHDGW